MGRTKGIVLTVLFGLLGALTSIYLWPIFGSSIVYQVIITILISAIGEHIVSSQGYYFYTERNGLFVGNVPLWIPFMWVFAVQSSMICAIAWGHPGITAALGSGVVAALVDFAFLEPFMCRQQQYWIWQSVNKGYFSFLPRELHRFTAPPGNYITWLLFPIIMNLFLVLISTL